MAARRTYGDRCGVARALDVVGERWALLVVRELLLGPKRFTDLRDGLPGLSADVLSQRLRGLEAAAVVRRRTLPPPAGSTVYELTPWGRDLEPVVLELGRWGSRAAFPSGRPRLGADATAIALKTLFDAGRARGLDASVELRLGAHDVFRAAVAGGALELVRGTADHPDAVVEAGPSVLAAVLWHARPLADALRAGDVRIEGSRRVARRFLRLFPAPEPAAAAGG